MTVRFKILQTAMVASLILCNQSLAADKMTSSLLDSGRQTQWVSRLFSENIWNYRVESSTNPDCTKHFQVLRQNQENFTTWALQMFDASDLIPGGFLVGDSYRLGNFEECINTLVPEELEFSAQYCLSSFTIGRSNVTLKFSETRDEWRGPIWNRVQAPASRAKVPKNQFSLSFCIPNTCSAADLQQYLQALLDEQTRNNAYDIKVTVTSQQCTTKEHPLPPPGHFIFRYSLIIATAFMIFVSIFDVFLAAVGYENHDITKNSFDKASGVEKWLIPFSIFRNARQLFSQPTSPDDYKILHGIKGLLMTMTIVGHRSMTIGSTSALTNWTYFEERIDRFSIFYVTISIPDVFLSISGFLLCLSMVKQLESNNFGLRRHIANKLIRILPPLMFVLASCIYILPYVGSGPLWKTVFEEELDYCRKGWWTNLLFINNYINLGEWCLPHFWYTATDLHSFIAGSIIVYLCWRCEGHKWLILALALSISFLIPFMVTYHNRYEGLLKLFPDFLSNPRENKMLVHLYMKSHNRFGGYMVGIIAAFCLKSLQMSNYTFSKGRAWAGIFFGTALIAVSAVARHLLHLPSTQYNVVQHALFAGLNAQVTCAGVFIIIIIHTITDFGALDSLFLTQNFFTLFSKLSYWAFLTNIPLIVASCASFKTAAHVTNEEMAFGGQFWGDILFVNLMALLCYLLIDAPINHFKPAILRRISRKQPAVEKKVH